MRRVPASALHDWTRTAAWLGGLESLLGTSTGRLEDETTGTRLLDGSRGSRQIHGVRAGDYYVLIVEPHMEHIRTCSFDLWAA
jgi:hypothetical protein